MLLYASYPVPPQDDDTAEIESAPVEFVQTIQAPAESLVQPQPLKAVQSPTPSSVPQRTGAITPHSCGSIVPYSPSEDGSVASADGLEVRRQFVFDT